MLRLRYNIVVALAAAAAVMCTASSSALAQSYPNRPIRLIAPFPPGGSIDLVARLVGQWLSNGSATPVIENKPGAGGNIGSEQAFQAPGDGYTLLLCSVANAISATLYAKLNYDFVRDNTPIAGLSRAPNVMVVHPSVPAKTVAEFIAYGKSGANINMASSASAPRSMCPANSSLLTGVKMQHVPYRGSAPMLTDLLAGKVQVAFDNLQPSFRTSRPASCGRWR